MRRSKQAALILAVIAGFFYITAAPAAEPVQVMVLGTWHFDNPGLDVHNAVADDVLQPRRQDELRELAAALAGFNPTKIIVERASPDLIDPQFSSFQPALLRQQRDEHVQIAYRLARNLGHRPFTPLMNSRTRVSLIIFPSTK